MPSAEEQFIQMLARGGRAPGLWNSTLGVNNNLATMGGVTGASIRTLANAMQAEYGIPVTQNGLSNVANLFNNPMLVNQNTGVRGDVDSDGNRGFADIASAMRYGARGGILGNFVIF